MSPSAGLTLRSTISACPAFVLVGGEPFDGANELVQLLQLLRPGVLSSVAARFVVIYSCLGVLNIFRTRANAGEWVSGGRSEIRTHGWVAPTAVFKTAALNHSAILPEY